MASGGKKKTTMAKFAREQKLRERRLAKQAKKEARKNAPMQPDEPADEFSAADDPALTADADAPSTVASELPA